LGVVSTYKTHFAYHIEASGVPQQIPRPALKAGVWFRRGRRFIVSPDSLGTACPQSGRNSTYRPVQISGASSTYRPQSQR
jgi:hypothetical protein